MKNTESKNFSTAIDVEYKNACDYFGIEQDSIFITAPEDKEDLIKDMVYHCRLVLIKKYHKQREAEIAKEIIEEHNNREVSIVWMDEITTRDMSVISKHKKISWCNDLYQKFILGKPKDE